MGDAIIDLPSPPELLRAYAARAKKRFGQHFLTDAQLLDRIIGIAGVQPGDRVLEVGPGCGTLTSRLLRRGARVVCIEIDRDAAAFLRQAFTDQPLEIIEADALSVDLAAAVGAGSCRVVSNLPYNVGTQIMFRLLESDLQIEQLALMFQREVAERIVAEPRTKSYGAMTLQLAELASTRIAMRVKPGSFTPPPKVDSAVVLLEPHRTPRIEDEALRVAFRAVVTAGFAMRRKTLKNALGARFGVDVATRAIEHVGLDLRTRAEELTFDQFLAIAAAMQDAENGEQ